MSNATIEITDFSSDNPKELETGGDKSSSLCQVYCIRGNEDEQRLWSLTDILKILTNFFHLWDSVLKKPTRL